MNSVQLNWTHLYLQITYNIWQWLYKMQMEKFLKEFHFYLQTKVEFVHFC